MSEFAPKSGGWLESSRRMGESLLALLRSRSELIAVEWQEEKLRLISLLIWLGLAVVIGVAGVLVALFALVFWLWTAAGYAGLIGLAVVALTMAAGMLWALRRKILTGPPPFAQTVAEFRKDEECLRRKD